MTEVSYDETPHTVSRRCALYQCRGSRVDARLSTNHTGACEFRRGAERSASSRGAKNAARPIGRRADRFSEGRAQNYSGAGNPMAASGRSDAREREFARSGDQGRPAGPRVDGCGPASRAARAIREGARRERRASSRGVQAALREPLAGAAASGQPTGCAAPRTASPRLSPRNDGGGAADIISAQRFWTGGLETAGP